LLFQDLFDVGIGDLDQRLVQHWQLSPYRAPPVPCLPSYNSLKNKSRAYESAILRRRPATGGSATGCGSGSMGLHRGLLVNGEMEHAAARAGSRLQQSKPRLIQMTFRK
jgi:hypothetical protein